jgi:hypothetical protein
MALDHWNIGNGMGKTAMTGGREQHQGSAWLAALFSENQWKVNS